MSGIKKENNEKVDGVVNYIVETIDIDLDFFDIENVNKKSSLQN